MGVLVGDSEVTKSHASGSSHVYINVKGLPLTITDLYLPCLCQQNTAYFYICYTYVTCESNCLFLF